MADVYTRYIDPAKTGSWGRTSTGEFESGIFAIHITYPDTEYGDEIEDWEAGVNTQDWRQGVSLLIRTPLASSSATISEALNVIPIDLKQAKADHNNAAYTYDLGTEEATRFIAAKINSRRIKMKGENDLTKYLRARYVRQSLPQKYEVKEVRYEAQGGGTTTLTAELATRNLNGFPSELIDNFSLKAESSTTSPYIAAGTYENPTMRHRKSADESDYNEVHVVLGSTPTITGSPSAGDALTNTFTLIGESPKHTIAITWETYEPSTDYGYWAAANCGPIVQGMGAIGVHRLIAKPMDGGNMGLPSVNAISRSGITSARSLTTHGYNRFSIEGLNSCVMTPMPPPDRKHTSPSIQGITTLHPDTETDLTSNGRLRIQEQEYGTAISRKGITGSLSVELENGDYSFSMITPTVENNYVSTGSNGIHLKNMQTGSGIATAVAHGLKDSSEEAYARPFRIVGDVNTERVQGLQITNEHLVFEPMTVVDDLGNELLLQGGSPLGTVIRDFEVENAREDPTTGEILVGPSAPNDTVPPNLKIQLPKQEDIPGGIFVRSGHDRVQAWSNQTWGMGGLTAPDPRKAGKPESASPYDPSQFETHDRTLVFHCQRILHDKMESVFGLDLSVKAGSVPSGTTRLFSAHRMSDHAERGSLLKQTNNGTETGNPIPHHRIRFGRQGHSFVMPFCHRGTPMSMRRQLHRSHGSAYSLMFEAETEYKHFGFGNTNSTNSSSVFQLDTMDVKEDSAVYSTGSFSADGLPLDELKGLRLIDADGAYTSATHRSVPDYLFAPGQTHTSVEGTPEDVAFALAEIDGSISTGAATKLSLQGSTLTANNRYTTASEFMLNGFFLNNYLGMGGRPEPIQRVATDYDGNWFIRGYHEGVVRPRVATELATVPPLLCHDPELLNMAGVPVSASTTIPSTSFGTSNQSHADMALTKAGQTTSGATPDAFLCTWLAEYSHPAFFGTMREHFMTFRYRESGMPRSLNFPATRGLFLRNHSVNGNYGTKGSAAVSLPFERIYVAQWMQNYAYNGLNAGGHGNIEGLRGIGAVLMGHSTRREARGTIQLYSQNGTERYSRGEGIGDSLNPRTSIGVVKGIDVDSDDEDLNMQFFVLDPYVAVDVSRRLPVRAWGFRTASSGPNMLAGDPTETQNTYAVLESGRFDGGVHDSVEDIPNIGAFINDTNLNAVSRDGLHRTVPVGFVANDFTAEAHVFERNTRQSNEKIKAQDEQLGIGASLGITTNGQLSPDSMAAGMWDYKLNDTRPTTLPVSGAVLWLKADTLDLEDGDAVSSWIDSSSNKWEFTQATASAQPTFIKKDSAMNNRPAIDCDGGDSLTLPFDSKLNTAEMTLFVVSYVDSDTNTIQGVIESRSTSPRARSGWLIYARMDNSGSNNNEYQFWAGADTTWKVAKTPDNSAVPQEASILTGKIFGGDGNGSASTLELYQNGYMSSDGTLSANYYKADAQPYDVGKAHTLKLNGKIAEVVQYDRKLTTAEQYEVEAYLSRKYAIPISPDAAFAHTGNLFDIDNIPTNKGSDPFIDLVQHTGGVSYPQEESLGALSAPSPAFGSATDLYHLKGNALHANVHSINHNTNQLLHYPPSGHSFASYSGHSITETRPDMINEITDVRQIQARTEPRLGLIMEVESERNENKDTNYAIVGTRAMSLHTDLMLGHHFPVLPSHTTKTLLANEGFTTDGTGSASTAPDFTEKPTWSPDTNASKGAISLSNDTVRTDYKTHALDSWAIRGVSDLPAWGGVFILRKTYLNRVESENAPLNTEIDENTSRATTSHPRRKYVDYIVRPVRPLKLFGFASDILQDGWVLGPRCSISTSTLASQPFDRDKRYGVFEMNYGRGENEVEPITSAGSAFTMDFPDANEYDITWHLIPTANMLQFAKADAHRIDSEGNFNPKIEARYSQAQTTGGGEPIYQSETRYEQTTGVMGDHARQVKQHKITQSKDAMRYFPRVKVLANKGSGVFLVDDASVLPPTGKLFALDHSNVITYSAINDNDLTTTGTLADLGGNTVSDFTGLELYFTDVSSIPTSAPGTIRYARSPLVKQAVAPTLVDNAVVAMQLVSQAWYYYNEPEDVVSKTALNYRGLLHYEPSDFVMATQSPFTIKNGNSRGVVQNKNGLDEIRSDGRIISADFTPPYVIDSNNIKWRISEVIREQNNTIMVFKDMSGKSLSDSGMAVGDVIAGQAGYIGIRTSDAAMHLLNDAGGGIAGITITPTASLHNNSKDIETYLDAHPMLRQINDHSKQYISRDTRGLNTMEVVRNISQLDGRQIINERNGTIVFSDKVFKEKGIRIGIENGVESVKVSKLFDSPNEIVIVGDVIAGNEIVFIRVRDSEKIRQASAGGEEEVIKTLRQQIPGVKSVSAARKLAKTLLARAENGAPMIHIQGLMNATSVEAGDIIEVNLPTQGVIGKFVVFEARHHYQSLKTDLTVAQYEKGIEGILADIKTSTVDVSGLSASSGDKDIKENLAMSASVAIISVHRVRVRNVNETGFIIGARHKNGLGKIGVRDGNKRGFPIGMSKSRNYVVK
jgi:hypothetical protein